MPPIKKNQTLKEYGEAAAQELIQRVESALAAEGVRAAWNTIFRAVCSEGQHVREVSPAAARVYEFYIVIAVTFLTQFPDKKKVLELATRVKEDLGCQVNRLSKMLDNKLFTSDECISTG